VTTVRPPRSIAELFGAPGGNLLVLRAFLGGTFCFAGLQKLANANFFRAGAPGSFHAQLEGAIATSPLHHLLDPALHVQTLVAVVISCGEIAVGLGTLAGLAGRVAALGGMLLSLSFFLTVSYNDSPYYYGADIVFLFAWTPLLIGGAGQWSLDALLAYRFPRVADPSLRPREAEVVARRAALGRLVAFGSVAGFGVVLGAVVTAAGRAITPGRSSATRASSTTPSSTSSGSGSSTKGSGTTVIGRAASVPIGSAASFTDPALGVPAFVVHTTAESFRGFSAICTHAGCTVQFDRSAEQFACPCHGSIFDAKTGAVVQGPAQLPLPAIAVHVGANGDLLVEG
jgi:thiosulfate dehydrogenase [quinone] large subunit